MDFSTNENGPENIDDKVSFYEEQREVMHVKLRELLVALGQREREVESLELHNQELRTKLAVVTANAVHHERLDDASYPESDAADKISEMLQVIEDQNVRIKELEGAAKKNASEENDARASQANQKTAETISRLEAENVELQENLRNTASLLAEFQQVAQTNSEEDHSHTLKEKLELVETIENLEAENAVVLEIHSPVHNKKKELQDTEGEISAPSTVADEETCNIVQNLETENKRLNDLLQKSEADLSLAMVQISTLQQKRTSQPHAKTFAQRFFACFKS